MINFNFKNQDFINATKVVLVNALTLTLIHKLTTPLGLYFALYIATCVTMMQAGETKREQFLSMSAAGIVFLFFLGFGLMVKHHLFIANIAIVIFAFMAFYLPNLGLTYKLPPVMGMIFYVFVISMPQYAPLWPTMFAGTIAAVVAIAVYFLFWPYEVKHELTLLAQTTIHEYRGLLKDYLIMLRRQKPNQRAHDIEDANDLLIEISRLLASYEKLNESSANTLRKEETDYFDILYLRLYSLLQINTMILERFPMLTPEVRPAAQQILRNLITQLQAIEYRFDAMVPHSLIAKNVIGRSLHLGKVITKTLTLQGKKPRKARLTEEEFNHLLEKLIAERTDANKRFAFGLLRIQELLDNIRILQANIHFDVSQAVFL